MYTCTRVLGVTTIGVRSRLGASPALATTPATFDREDKEGGTAEAAKGATKAWGGRHRRPHGRGRVD